MRLDGTVAVPLPMMVTIVLLSMLALGRTLVMSRAITGSFALYAYVLLPAACTPCCCPELVTSTTRAVSFDWRSLPDQSRPC